MAKRGSSYPDSKYDPEQIKMGIEVELEHVSDREIAKRIAKDHLAEMPDYYTRLDHMESGDYDELEKIIQRAGLKK